MNKPNAQAKSQGKSGNYITQNGTVLFDDGKNQCVVMMGHAYADRFVFDPSMKTTTCAIVIEPYIVGATPCMIRVEMATLSNPKARHHCLPCGPRIQVPDRVGGECRQTGDARIGQESALGRSA